MKKKLFLIPFLLVTFNAVYSQNMDWPTGKITYENNDSSRSDKDNYVEYGTFSSFTILNINRFLYSVTISGKRIELETPVPTELQTLFRLPRTDLEATANNEALAGAVAAVNLQAKKITDFKQNIAQNNSNIRAFNLIKKINQPKKILNINLENAAETFEEDYKKFIIAAKDLSGFIENAKLNRVRLINFAQQDVSLDEMRNNIARLTLSKDPSVSYNQLVSNYEKLQEQYDQIGEEGGDQSELDKPMQTAKNTLKVIQEEKPAALYADVDFLYNELQNKNNFKAVAPPVQADGDYINYKVAITPSRTNTLGTFKNPSNFDFDIPVKGGWKTDFSVGPTFSFGHASRDDKYFFEQSSNDGKVILKKRDNDNIVSPGLAAMMHFYRRSGKDFNWGGMMGVGAGFQSIDDVNLSFFAGLSAVLGKSQKIMISAGYSFLNVERLKTGEYKVDNEYLADTSLNDVTEKVIKGSLFVSVSYNLTNRLEK